jgi:phospholipase A-2-activating protein
MEYKLSASLSGHEDDVSDKPASRVFGLTSTLQVRSVAFPTSKAVISASRDGTVRLWKLLSDNPPLYDATISSHATAFVNSVAYLPPTQQFPEGLIISGGKDTVIEVREPSKKPEDNAEALLLGHSHNVCSLDVDAAGRFIVSGSWDAEARIWPVGKWECETVLRGHEGMCLRAWRPYDPLFSTTIFVVASFEQLLIAGFRQCLGSSCIRFRDDHHWLR